MPLLVALVVLLTASWLSWMLLVATWEYLLTSTGLAGGVLCLMRMCWWHLNGRGGGQMELCLKHFGFLFSISFSLTVASLWNQPEMLFMLAGLCMGIASFTCVDRSARVGDPNVFRKTQAAGYGVRR